MQVHQKPARKTRRTAMMLLTGSIGLLVLGAILSRIFENSWPSWMNTWQAHASFVLPLAVLGTIAIFGLAGARGEEN